MPTYFFHLRDGTDVLLDPDGRVLAGIAEVARDALREARALISDEALTGSIKLAQRIEVEDASGLIIHRLNFWDAVKITHPA
jgi:hypothetical protein